MANKKGLTENRKAQTKKIPTRKLISDFLACAQRSQCSRRAQMKMFENIGVMIIFFFLLVFGASFYFTLQKASLEREMVRVNQLASVQQALRLTYLPELDCSFAGVQIDNCFDRLKVESLIAARPTSNLAYFNVFGYSTVSLRTIYPKPAAPKQDIIYSRKLNATDSDIIKTQVPVLICEKGCDQTDPRYSFGILEIDSYVPSAK